MRIKDGVKYIIIAVILPLRILAGSLITVTETDHKILYYAFNQEFDKGEQLVDKMIKANPDIPKYYFLKVITTTFKNQAESERMDFETRREFKERENKKLLKYTEDSIEKFKDIEKKPENKYYLAYLYGYYARMQGETGSYFSAFKNGKKSKGMLEELVEENPDFYDAYLLLGMFEYYADRLGGVSEFIAGILGFSGSRDTGIEYMKIAYEKGDMSQPFAEFILGETYLFQESNSFEALKYFGKLVKQYPNNSSFYDWYVRVLMNLHQYKKAGLAILNDTKGHVTGYTRGMFFLGIGDYETAHKLFQDVIKNKKAKWRSTFEHSKVLDAYCRMYMGETINADSIGLDFYKKDQEKLWKEELTLTQQNIKLAKELQEYAVKINTGASTAVVDDPSGVKGNQLITAGYNYYTGVYYFKKHKYKEAEKYFLNAAENNKKYSQEAVEFLLEIYSHVSPDKKQLDKLNDAVDDAGGDNLKFSLMGLKHKLNSK